MSESENLPVASTPSDHHDALLSAGGHPEISENDTRKEILDGDGETRVFKHGGGLIGFLERNQCPICGRERVSISETFGYGVSRHYRDDDGERHYNWTVRDLLDDGYRAVNCTAARGKGYFIGIATPEAVEAYRDWQDDREAVAKFQDTAARLAFHPDTLTRSSIHDSGPIREVDVPFESQYDHGHLIAAIFHRLGCTGYDPRDLLGRTHVKKTTLAAILLRLWSVETSPNPDYTATDWAFLDRYGNKYGKVQWEIPGWVDYDDVAGSKYRRTGTYDGVMQDFEWIRGEEE